MYAEAEEENRSKLGLEAGGNGVEVVRESTGTLVFPAIFEIWTASGHGPAVMIALAPHSAMRLSTAHILIPNYIMLLYAIML